MNVFTNNYPNKEAWFADHPSVKNDIELVTKARWAEQNTEGDFILTKKGLGNLQEDDVYKSPEQLLEMISKTLTNKLEPCRFVVRTLMIF